MRSMSSIWKIITPVSKCIRKETYESYFSGSPYKLVTSGSPNCNLSSLAECSAAATALGLSDTTASDDNQSGVSHDPPYCYVEGGTLKYNSNGLNTGDCSSSENCICRKDGRCFP